MRNHFVGEDTAVGRKGRPGAASPVLVTADPAECSFQFKATGTEKSIKIEETFNNLYSKARLLAGQGKTQEAIATGEKALVLGKENKNNTADLEKRLAEWKAKM